MKKNKVANFCDCEQSMSHKTLIKSTRAPTPAITEMMKLRRTVDTETNDEIHLATDTADLYMGGQKDLNLEAQLAKEEAYMNQEVDWDAAEEHRKANLSFKMLDIDWSKDVEKCLCCNQPIPQEEHWFKPFLEDNDEFVKLGAPGLPLLFYFIRGLATLFFFVTILFFGWRLRFITDFDKVQNNQYYSDLGFWSGSIGI